MQVQIYNEVHYPIREPFLQVQELSWSSQFNFVSPTMLVVIKVHPYPKSAISLANCD